MKAIRTIALSVVVFGIITASLLFGVTSARAAGGFCEVGTGVNGIPCVPCTPTPYGGCIPGVSSIITTDSSAAIQDNKLDSRFVIIASTSILLGLLLVVNGSVIRQRMSGKKN